nr:MAG TPA: hypothetical protein [Caudoviricetes sp.]DAX24724.1 MAG TPA: hypothetical protein [Caudoviricetes sp.]DAY23551.1 MAG TPA: hypothetical protein [Caudoviricetes sp.]
MQSGDKDPHGTARKSLQHWLTLGENGRLGT